MESESKQPVVNSHNEWDPLEEVIVGVLEGSCYLPWHISLEACIHGDYVNDVGKYHREFGGKARSLDQIEVVQAQLAEFIHILEQEGVTIRQPEPVNQARPFATMDWQSNGGNAQANPRDSLLVVGNEIIEAPMSWRARYFEVHAYRKLLKDYFRQGARWTSAPKPQLNDDLYDPYWERSNDTYVTTEAEPVWDAADIARFGRDLVVQRSQVTNEFGAEWLQRHLGNDYRIHLVEFEDDDPLHIDTTFVPLCPGKVLVNPGRPIKQLPAIFENSDWDLLTPPRTTLPSNHPAYRSYEWYHLNILMLDHNRVIVEKEEAPFIQALKDWGFEPIPCAFRHAAVHFAGGFHCFTLDVRRRGELQSYF
jgi:glycine amidinotransferase